MQRGHGVENDLGESFGLRIPKGPSNSIVYTFGIRIPTKTALGFEFLVSKGPSTQLVECKGPKTNQSMAFGT